MTPILLLTHNNFDLTKKCVQSIKMQDVPTSLFVIDNGSTDGSREWISSSWEDGCYLTNENRGVSWGWNVGLDYWFGEKKYDFCLIVNNDTVLPPYFLSELLAYDVPFVTGVSVNMMSDLHKPDPRNQLHECPDFSAFLIRRDTWEKIGPFDTEMKHYASDLDYHIRAHRKGIHLMNSHVPFYHERSSTIKNSPPEERVQIETQANLDRAALKKKWGCNAWDDSYAAMFDPSTFGIDISKE